MARPDDDAPERGTGPVALFSCTPSGRVLGVGTALGRLSGNPAGLAAGTGAEELFHPASRARLRRALRAAADRAASGSAVFTLLRVDGTGVEVELAWSVLAGSGTEPQVVFVGPATAAGTAPGSPGGAPERERWASTAMLRAVADTSEEGIWVVSPTARTLYANDRLAEILGMPPERVRDAALLEVFGTDPALSGRRRSSRGRDPQRVEFPYAHPDGHERRLRVVAASLHAEDGTPEATVAMITDITDVRRVEEALRTAELQDGLTQLPNRALLVDRLSAALGRARRGTAVLLLDLDHFRMVNDSRGHDVGDELLVGVADRLVAAVPGDLTVARFGGDEFAVVCEDTDECGAHELARVVLAALDGPLTIDGASVHVTASVGVAVAPAGSGTSAVDLLRQADTAVHAAKGSGRGRVHVFEDTLGKDVEHRYALSAELRAALAEEALHLEYQPVVDLRTGDVIGLEALARWTHPERGPVPPASFVPVAELTGLAPELDRWVARRAVQEMAAMRAAGTVPADAYVAVNLSVTNLTEAFAVEDLVRWTEEAGLPPTQVVLEITETAVMQNTDLAVRLLRRLRDQGFRVALDDFGTGYSSLAYLRDLPISALKIDRSFVSGITEHPDVLAIVASIVRLGEAVGVDVVAEGVETPEQRALLHRIGVVTAQGWLWSQALPCSELIGGCGWTGAPNAWVGLPAEPANACATGDAGVAEGIRRLLALHRSGASVDEIVAALDADGLRSPAGLPWQRASVARVLAHQIRRASASADGGKAPRRGVVHAEVLSPLVDGSGRPRALCPGDLVELQRSGRE
ncbi:hypothetical protein DQ244_11500 [Blastococcus sp. TBT05-19]|uniref:putative bifunctional diguanylate cyclase/phosphodiesterase n=1 Tax=Blastococcus sp. TBT05-19 TaxID=2250581 RepID=UPI000DEA2F06|nr:bifunctional diguanylate cyclase/phosphodiesterase [Blastococcus sp. TBT05-19]RBY90097.1 hypothetical protein DQ244_11500 [Blastococcus sp. TBT05-19]